MRTQIHPPRFELDSRRALNYLQFVYQCGSLWRFLVTCTLNPPPWFVLFSTSPLNFAISDRGLDNTAQLDLGCE